MEDAREHRESPKKTKNRPFVSGRKDAVPPDFVSRKCNVPKKTLFASGNGLIRQALNANPVCDLRLTPTGSRATRFPSRRDLHQPSPLCAVPEKLLPINAKGYCMKRQKRPGRVTNTSVRDTRRHAVRNKPLRVGLSHARITRRRTR